MRDARCARPDDLWWILFNNNQQHCHATVNKRDNNAAVLPGHEWAPFKCCRFQSVILICPIMCTSVNTPQSVQVQISKVTHTKTSFIPIKHFSRHLITDGIDRIVLFFFSEWRELLHKLKDLRETKLSAKVTQRGKKFQNLDLQPSLELWCDDLTVRRARISFEITEPLLLCNREYSWDELKMWLWCHMKMKKNEWEGPNGTLGIREESARIKMKIGGEQGRARGKRLFLGRKAAVSPRWTHTNNMQIKQAVRHHPAAIFPLGKHKAHRPQNCCIKHTRVPKRFKIRQRWKRHSMMTKDKCL